MGNAKSTLANESRHAIRVAVFSANDVDCEFAKGDFTLQPGEAKELLTPKKGLQLVVSINGRKQPPLLLKPGDFHAVRKVGRTAPAPEPEPAREEEPATSDEADHTRQAARAKKGRRHDEQEWLDERDKYKNDSLGQLLVSLRKEEARQKAALPARTAEQVEAREAHAAEVDELTARIAALQSRNAGTGRPAPAPQQRPQPPPEPAFEINTDADSDELMAAINRLKQPARRGHAKKPSWDRTSQPRMVM